MSEFIYGHWRGTPARENRRTGVREFFQITSVLTYEGQWIALGLGYSMEFKPWPDQVDSDRWAELHRTL